MIRGTQSLEQGVNDCAAVARPVAVYAPACARWVERVYGLTAYLSPTSGSPGLAIRGAEDLKRARDAKILGN
jgi:hypothetical protein